MTFQKKMHPFSRRLGPLALHWRMSHLIKILPASRKSGPMMHFSPFVSSQTKDATWPCNINHIRHKARRFRRPHSGGQGSSSPITELHWVYRRFKEGTYVNRLLSVGRTVLKCKLSRYHQTKCGPWGVRPASLRGIYKTAWLRVASFASAVVVDQHQPAASVPLPQGFPGQLHVHLLGALIEAHGHVCNARHSGSQRRNRVEWWARR